MTKAEIRKRFMALRDKCQNSEFETVDGVQISKGREYSELHKLLEDTGNFDVNYGDNLRGRDGYEVVANADNLTFKECCTALTFLLRAERFDEGAFTEALADGTIYKLLKRSVEVM